MHVPNKPTLRERIGRVLFAAAKICLALILGFLIAWTIWYLMDAYMFW